MPADKHDKVVLDDDVARVRRSNLAGHDMMTALRGDSARTQLPEARGLRENEAMGFKDWFEGSDRPERTDGYAPTRS